MTNILVFLLILVILFGLEPTRAFIFGAFGFIFWAVVIFVVVVLIADAFTDKRTPEEKKKDEEARKEKERQIELEKRAATKRARVAQQKWFRDHPRVTKFSDFISNHMALSVALITILCIALIVGGVFIFLP